MLSCVHRRRWESQIQSFAYRRYPILAFSRRPAKATPLRGGCLGRYHKRVTPSGSRNLWATAVSSFTENFEQCRLGEAIPLVRDFHTSNDFIDFLKILDDKYHAGDVIRIVLDNHTVHTSRKVQDHLTTRPGRFILGFTPKHGFWLNMIESFSEK